MKTYILLTALTISFSLQAQREEIILEKSSVNTQEVIPTTWNITSLQELKEPSHKERSLSLTKAQWSQASSGTPDVFQVDSFMGGVGMVPKLDKLPVGSKGCFGFINQQVDSSNKKEYIGINLAKPLEEGKTYKLSFLIYKQKDTPKSSMALYGNDQEKALPFGNDSTMEGPTFYNDDFEVLGWAEFNNASDWRKVQITFIATKNYQSLVLGPDEKESPAGVNEKHYNYYFIDGIELSQTKNNSAYNITPGEMPFLTNPIVNGITPNPTVPTSNGSGNNNNNVFNTNSEKIKP